MTSTTRRGFLSLAAARSEAARAGACNSDAADGAVAAAYVAFRFSACDQHRIPAVQRRCVACRVHPALQTKLLLVAAGLVNFVIAHVGPWRRVALWGTEASGGAKVTALVSLLLWPGAVCAGRLIAYL